MSFQMIHMEIAYRLLSRLPQIKNAAEFILGSVAPDSVHMNADYTVDRKVKSHMFEECGKWSDTQDYQRWEKNIHDVFCQYYGCNEKEVFRDFTVGLCVHCLTDYWNDLKIWKALQRKYVSDMGFEAFKEAYYPEACGIDIWLYQNSQNTGVIRKMLSQAAAFDIENMVNVTDIEKQRKNLLEVQYHVDQIDVSGYRFLSEHSIEEFIEDAVNDIAEKINVWSNEVI